MSLRQCRRCNLKYDVDIYGNNCPYCSSANVKNERQNIPCVYGPPPIRERILIKAEVNNSSSAELRELEYKSHANSFKPYEFINNIAKDRSKSYRKWSWKYLLFFVCSVLIVLACMACCDAIRSVVYGPPPIAPRADTIPESTSSSKE